MPGPQTCHHARHEFCPGMVAGGAGERSIVRGLLFFSAAQALQRGHSLTVANFVCSDDVFVVSNTIYMPMTQTLVFSAKILLRTLARRHLHLLQSLLSQQRVGTWLPLPFLPASFICQVL